MLLRGGYYMKARCIMESDIINQPPHIREVWDWVLMNANYTVGKSSGVAINRGQLFTTLDKIREGLSWYVGYRKESYTKDHMKKAMKALKKAAMITTNKSTRGLLITICNYDIYQNPSNYDSTNESTSEGARKAPSKHQSSTTINKNDKNLKNKEKIKEIAFFGSLNWKRSKERFLTISEKKSLQTYEEENGAVNWNNIEEYKKLTREKTI